MKYIREVDWEKGSFFDFSPIETTLLPNDFRVVDKGVDHIEFHGVGLNSNKESPIKGATKILITVSNGKLVLNSNLGGVLKMSLFIILFPPLLVLVISLFKTSSISILNYLWAWLLIGPLISLNIYLNTKKSLNTMLDNAIRLNAKLRS